MTVAQFSEEIPLTELGERIFYRRKLDVHNSCCQPNECTFLHNNWGICSAKSKTQLRKQSYWFGGDQHVQKIEIIQDRAFIYCGCVRRTYQTCFADDLPRLVPLGYCIWKQNGAPAHTPAVTLDELNKEDQSEAYFAGRKSWPANSLHVNPIENCRAIVQHDLSGKTFRNRGLAERMSGELLAALCGSMKRRIELCTAAKGAHIDY